MNMNDNRPSSPVHPPASATELKAHLDARVDVPEGYWAAQEDAWMAHVVASQNPRDVERTPEMFTPRLRVGWVISGIAALWLSGLIFWPALNPSSPAEPCVTFACLLEAHASAPLNADEASQLDSWSHTYDGWSDAGSESAFLTP